ncbi:putative reverse transcriptase zinc-binding domain-containing protein [Helianthus annuus]|nr:putative reverse transcriptase zinc-binding domain-containing protein [Helianthus annuus]
MLNQVCLSNTPDMWQWINEDGQNFSVKDLRIELANLRYKKEEDLVFEWNAWATPKANYLGWRALMGRVASKVGLSARGVSLPILLYNRCGYQVEDPNHIFVNCLFAKSVWWNVFSWTRVPFPGSLTSLKGYLRYFAFDEVEKAGEHSCLDCSLVDMESPQHEVLRGYLCPSWCSGRPH